MSNTLSQRFRFAAQITRGLFLTDERRSVWGRVWQLFSRFAWELPQTFAGWLFTLIRAFAGGVDRVNVLGGITFASGKACSFGGGVSLGSFIDLWLWREMGGDGDGIVVGNQLCMHEFGHTADSQRFGWLYLPVIGLPSLLSALGKGNHNVFWTELRANRHAKRYFSKHYSVAWSEISYPTENLA